MRINSYFMPLLTQKPIPSLSKRTSRLMSTTNRLITEAVAKRLGVDPNHLERESERKGQSINPSLINKLDHLATLDENKKLCIPLEELTESEISQTFDLPLVSSWSEATSDALFTKISMRNQKIRDKMHEDLELDQAIEKNKGRIENIDDFDFTHLVYRASQGKLDTETYQRVQAKKIKNQISDAEAIREENEELKKNPHLLVSKEVVEKALGKK